MAAELELAKPSLVTQANWGLLIPIPIEKRAFNRNDSVGIAVHLLGLFAMSFVARHLRISS